LVKPVAQTILFGALSNKTFGDPDFDLTATASSGLAVSYTTLTSGSCTVTGVALHIAGAGLCTVAAHQAGNTNYTAAQDVNQSFSIGQATATLVVSDLTQTYDGTPRPVTVTTTPAGLSGVSVSYTGLGSTPPTLTGSYTVGVTLSNPNYTAAPFSGTLVVK